MYVSHYNRNYLEKYIVNQKILMNKMCLEFDFTYAMQISLRSVNPISYYIYIYIYVKTIIVIISKNKSKIKKNLKNKMCLEFNFTYAVQISSGSVNKYVTSRDAVTSL